MSSLEKAPSEEGRPLGKLVLDPRGSCANAPNSARGPGFHSQKGKLKDHCGRGLGQGVVIATGVTLEWAVKKDKEYRAMLPNMIMIRYARGLCGRRLPVPVPALEIPLDPRPEPPSWQLGVPRFRSEDGGNLDLYGRAGYPVRGELLVNHLRSGLFP